MFRILIAPVVIPLVEIAILTDGIGAQLVQAALHGRQLRRFGTNGAKCLHEVYFQFAYDGEVGCAAVAGHTHVALVGDIFVFGRSRRRCDELVLTGLLGIFYQPGIAEIVGTLHQRQGNLAQIVAVASEEVTLPQGVDEPCTTHVPTAPHRTLAVFSHRIGHCP